MKRYESYQPSGTAWLGYVPAAWDVQKIGALFAQRKVKVSDTDYAPLSVSKGGIVPQLSTAAKTDDGDNRKLVCTGDFVINSRSDRKSSCGVSPFDGSVSLINIVLEPRQGWNNRYVHYLLKSQPFSEEYFRNGRGIVADLWTTRYSEMKSILLPVPPRAEQDQIVRYLDWQVSKINKLIAAKKQKIDLLLQQKQRIVSNAVLRGLDPSIRMQPSDSRFIGDIPAHWNLMRGKYLFAEHDKRSASGKDELLSVSHITGVTPRSQKNVTMFKSESLVGYKCCNIGDIAANTMWLWQGAIGVSLFEGVISPSYNTYHQIADAYDRRYLDYLLRVKPLVDEYIFRSSGIRKSRLRLYPKDFLSIRFPVPPIAEQRVIVECVKQKCSLVDANMNAIEKEIDAIHDLRTRLISDVVTGQIDVRSIEIPAYEMVEESATGEDEPDEDEVFEESDEQEE